MATIAQIEAAIVKAEAAGDAPAVKALRDRLSQMQGPSPEAIQAAADKAKAAGDTAAYDALIARLPAPTEPPATPAITADQPAPPPRAASESELGHNRATEFAGFEMFNPELKGRYTPETMPKAGDTVMGVGGGGKSGGARMVVRDWRRKPQEQFGDTAKAMIAGPVAAMKEFGGGLSGGPSPSRDFLSNDPLTKGLPSPILSTLGAMGDAGGAALSGIGAGLSGVVGLATEAVPGQTADSREKLGNELLGMSQFAVPELAGGSSIVGRAASVAPKAIPKPPVSPSALAGDVAAAEKLGIPVMRSDVSPPKTFVGRVAQKGGESIPVAGTSGPRAAQNAKRIEAAQNFAREYGADSLAPAIDDVTASVFERRGAELTKYTKQKKSVIESLSDKGAVPVPSATAAIDARIAALRKQKMAGLEPVIAKLEEFKTSLDGQGLSEIEANRAVIGEAFKGMEMGSIRTTGEKALSAVYGPLKKDMADFIKAKGGNVAVSKWADANAKLSSMTDELGNTALKRVLTKGEDAPEVARGLLFSAKPSDVRLLYKNLTPEGQAAARTAVLQEAVSKAGGIESLSPEKFATALGKLSNQMGVLFKGEDLAAAKGLIRALELTKRASVAGAAPLTGVQNMPAIIAGLVGSVAGSVTGTVGVLGGLGGIARIYEATGVQRVLRGLAKAQTPKAQSLAMKSLDAALKEAGVPATQIAAQEAANSNANPDYQALHDRYGK